MDAGVTRASLLTRVRDPSDQAAWREFEARYGDLILGYARARGLQHADAEDVRQGVLVKLSRTLRGFEYQPARGRFRDYLRRVVRTVLIDERSRPNALRNAVDGSMIEAVSTEDPDVPDVLWEREWTDHHYRRALRTIRETFEPRSVELFERLVAGEDLAALAARFGTSEQAVHKVKQRIRERMKELIAAQVREEDGRDA